MRRRLHKMYIILTACGLVVTVAGCGVTMVTDEGDTSKLVEAADNSGISEAETEGTDSAGLFGRKSTEGESSDEETGTAGEAVDGTTAKPDAASSTSRPGTTEAATAKPGSTATTEAGTTESTTEATTEATTAHVHDWVAVYKTVHHNEEGHYEDVLWTESYSYPVYVLHMVCNGCEFDYTANGVEPPSHTCPDGGIGSWTWVKVYDHDEVVPAEYRKEWVVDKAAWDEQLIDYYKCSKCGGRK